MKIRVKCTFTIEVEVPDDPDYDKWFDIEDNHCPATGFVGEALDKHIIECEANHVCWACSLGGKCEIQHGTSEHVSTPVITP